MSTTSLNVSPTRAIVTGHSRGLGAALASQLLQRDIAVLGVSRSRHSTLHKDAGNRLVEAEIDLSDATAIETWLAGGALRRFVEGASCVLLFNNAGIVEPIGPLDAQDGATIARAVALNVTAPLVLASAFAKATHDVAERRIVHISSGAGRNALAGWSVYCATKAALDHHARTVALDANRALRICSIAPGVVDTEMQAAIRSASVERFPSRERFEQLKTSGALATPDATADKLVDFALSDDFGTAPTADVRELPAK